MSRDQSWSWSWADIGGIGGGGGAASVPEATRSSVRFKTDEGWVGAELSARGWLGAGLRETVVGISIVTVNVHLLYETNVKYVGGFQFIYINHKK